MFANPTSWEIDAYQSIQASRLVRWYSELNQRSAVWTRRLLITILLGLSVWLVWFLYTSLSLIGLVALAVSMFWMASHHELGHYFPMTRAGITPAKVGMGVFEGPFKHLQFKFNPKWLPGDCEFWFSPATFMIAAYVDEGEEGMKKIMKLDRKTRAGIFGGGIANNLIMALFCWSIIQLHQWDGTRGVWSALTALAIGLVVAYVLTDSFRLQPTKLNYGLSALAVGGVTYLVVTRGLWEIPPPSWAIVSIGLMIFLLEYRSVVASRFFPVLGLAFTLFLAWNLVPNLGQDIWYALTHGGAAHGGTAEVLGPRSLLELYAISGGEPSAHIIQQIGRWNTAVYVWLSQQWIFVFYMGFLLSTGLALTNLLPVKGLDGGYLWQDLLDPNQRYPRWRKWGLLIPTVPILVTLAVILIGTELGSLRWIGFTVFGLYLIAKPLRWRLRMIQQHLEPNPAPVPYSP